MILMPLLVLLLIMLMLDDDGGYWVMMYDDADVAVGDAVSGCGWT